MTSLVGSVIFSVIRLVSTLAELAQVNVEGCYFPLWKIVVGDTCISSSYDQRNAIVYASDLLGCSEDEIWGISEDKLDYYHSRPLNFERAKNFVRAKALWMSEDRLRTDVDILDQYCIEYEWGWLVEWAPTKPHSPNARWTDNYHYPWLVDRLTAQIHTRGFKGLQFSVIQLLMWRVNCDQNEYPVLRDSQNWFNFVEIYESLGLFTPISNVV